MFPATLIGYFYRKLAIGYLNTGRDLRRMEANTRSPIFANFGELLEGIVTVRAFSAEQRFLDNHNAQIDVTTKVGVLVESRGDMSLTNMSPDVVHLLDDEPLVAPVFRCHRRLRCLDHDLVRAIGLRQGWHCWCMYHLRYGIHDIGVLGVSVLDSVGTGSEVRSSMSSSSSVLTVTIQLG